LTATAKTKHWICETEHCKYREFDRHMMSKGKFLSALAMNRAFFNFREASELRVRRRINV